MELVTRSERMLLQNISKRGFAITFSVIFTLYVVSIIIGAFGPPVYEKNDVSAYACPQDFQPPAGYDPYVCAGVDMSLDDAQWTGEIRHLDKLNQNLQLEASIWNKKAALHGIQQQLNIGVDMFGRDSDEADWMPVLQDLKHTRTITCDHGSARCNTVVLVDELHIRFESYKFNVRFLDPTDWVGDVTFSFYYINHQYTLFELWWRFAFLFVTFVLAIAYTVLLRGVAFADWTLEQKWGAVLLFALMAYNNPFYPLEILAAGWFPVFLNRLLYATFLVLLLLFWLIMFDGIRREGQAITFKSFYLPKLLLIGLIWLMGVVTFTWNQMKKLDDPAYDTSKDEPGFLFFAVVFLGATVVYVFWLIYAALRAFNDLRNIPYLGIRVKFFLCFSFVVALIGSGGLVFGFVGYVENNAAQFLSYISLFNLYVYTLAFFYLPSKDTEGQATVQRTSERISMVRLEEEDDEQAPRSSQIEMEPVPEQK